MKKLNKITLETIIQFFLSGLIIGMALININNSIDKNNILILMIILSISTIIIDIIYFKLNNKLSL